MGEQVAFRLREQFEAETLRSAAHLATILGFAQAAGVELEADVNTVEDSSRCQQVANVAAMIGQPRPAGRVTIAAHGGGGWRWCQRAGATRPEAGKPSDARPLPADAETGFGPVEGTLDAH